MRRTIIGLIGRIGCGKTIVAKHLAEKHGAAVYRFSDILKKVLYCLHKPDTRENLQSLGTALRKAFEDEGILAKTLKQDILSDNGTLIVIDGIRYAEEFDMVKGLGGNLVYITAPAEVRYERIVSRGTRGEKRISLGEFKASEEKETERGIDELGSKADIGIENTGTSEDLIKKIDEMLEKLI